MFPRRYYPAAAFAPRFFPQSGGSAPTPEAATPGGTFRRGGDTARAFGRTDTARVFRRGTDTARVFRR